jgi:hypothetical protein
VARPRDLFVPLEQTWDDVLTFQPTFAFDFRFIFKPVLINQKWYLIVFDIANGLVYFFSPLPSLTGSESSHDAELGDIKVQCR